MQKHALFARQVMLRLSRLSRHLMERSKLYAVTKVRGRVYAILLDMHATKTAEHDSDLIVPLPTDDDIASRVGTGRSYVNRVISQLGSKKIVEKRSDGWKILDLPALELLSQEAQAD